MKTSDKKNEILACAQALIQRLGYNGFSYADISAAVGIRKASIHHHFPTKIDLAVAVIAHYDEAFHDCMLNIDSQKEKNWTDKVRLYAELYKQALSEDKLCLCGMLASDMETLPEKVKNAARNFLSNNARWLSEILANNNPGLSNERSLNIAWQIINQLQGGVMMARILNNPALLSQSCEEMMTQLKHLS